MLAEGPCPTHVEAGSFASADRIEALTRKMFSFGLLRMPATAPHNRMLRWLDGKLEAIPGLTVRSQRYRMTRWQPATPGNQRPRPDLARAGGLTLVRRESDQPLEIASPIAFSKPTSRRGVGGKVVYLPEGRPITAENARGKIVLRDVPEAPVPYAGLLAVSHIATPDFLPTTLESYERPFLATASTEEIEAAARAGAVGFVYAFNVPTKQVRHHFQSHTGTLQHIPGVWVGVDERERLKSAATAGREVRIGVHAQIDRRKPTRNIIATVPGQSQEKIVIATNSDGNSWVQENAPAALIALADYFAALPLECRPRTIEFVFGSAHLGFTWDGTDLYARDLIASGNVSDVAFAFAFEHLGTQEVLPVDRENGPGERLVLTGKPEPYAWFAPTESPVLTGAMATAMLGRGQERSSVLRGIDFPPELGRTPVFCNFGGLANSFHGRSIPALGGISGPWTLWARTFGDRAIDFDRFWSQSLVVGDVVLALDDTPRALIEGAYPAERALVDAGNPSCDTALPPKRAPR